MSQSPFGRGVFAHANAGSGQSYGVYGRSNSASGAGVVARGYELGADIILGGNGNVGTGDDGLISSNPSYPSSDIVLFTNDTIRKNLEDDGDGKVADFEIRNRDDTLIYNINENDIVTFGGGGIAFILRPANDLGWLAINPGFSVDRTHKLGGNVDNYVID